MRGRLRRAVVALGALLVLAVVATGLRLEVPAPSGAAAVGRTTTAWADGDRIIPAIVWYPAVAGTGEATPYVPDLDRIAEGLRVGGGLPRPAVEGLRVVRHHVRSGASVVPAPAQLPLVLLSPGNQTNVAFYATLATEIASRGYVVVGVDHPGQVAAAALPGGHVAVYDPSLDVPGGVAAKIGARVTDLEAVLRGVRERPPPGLEGRIDLRRVAAIGHSNGGLAALGLCRADPTVLACANLDGQAAGGPLGVDAESRVPDQPTLVLTKEVDVHPTIADRFEAGGRGTYRIVVPTASHEDFADGALFTPTILPWAGRAERVGTTAARLVAAFLDAHVTGDDPTRIGREAVRTDVYVNAFPLRERPMLPAA